MSTDSILTNLVEADQRACALVDDAEEQLELTVANMEHEIEDFKVSYAEKAKKRIGLVRETEERASTEASGSINQRYDSLMQNLETVYSANHAKWEDELFNRCIRR